MGRKLLIAIGDDPDSLYGVRFVASFFRKMEDIEVTLLHVAPRFESMDAEEDQRLHRIDVALSRIYDRKAQVALEASRSILLGEGFSEGKIESKMLHQHHGMVEDIVDEAKQGGCDAVVLGRRGFSVFEKFFHPRLSSRIIELELPTPIWICRRPQRGLKHVLICLDGSRSSLNAAAHVARMVAEEDQHKFVLFHVDDGSGKDVRSIVEAGSQKLIDGGIIGERVSHRTIAAEDVAKAIEREAGGGDYAVVAVGQHGGTYESRSGKRFMGSKSVELLEVLDRTALWLVK